MTLVVAHGFWEFQVAARFFQRVVTVAPQEELRVMPFQHQLVWTNQVPLPFASVSETGVRVLYDLQGSVPV